jgi:spore coat protein U-like protein
MDEAVQALASQFQKDSAFKFVWLDASKEQHRKETGLLTLTGIPEDEG